MNKSYNIFIQILFSIFYFLNIKKKFLAKIFFNIGINNLLILSQKYDQVTRIDEVECKIFSQNGEDGIINYLISRLKIHRPNFIEIGVGTYIESNTRFIYEKFYPKGLIIDCIKNLKNKVFLNVNYWRGDLRVIEEKVSSSNINNLINQNCDFEIDIFSIDIDGLDYWVISNLKKNISKIFIAEYNAIFADKNEITVPDINNFDRKHYHYSSLCYGMSLLALINLMKNKGYYFVGTNSTKNNAFFVSEEFPKKLFFPNLIIYPLSYYIDSNIRESRDRKNNLNYLTGLDKIKEIQNCEIVDLTDGKNKKIKEIFKFGSN